MPHWSMEFSLVARTGQARGEHLAADLLQRRVSLFLPLSNAKDPNTGPWSLADPIGIYSQIYSEYADS